MSGKQKSKTYPNKKKNKNLRNKSHLSFKNIVYPKKKLKRTQPFGEGKDQNFINRHIDKYPKKQKIQASDLNLNNHRKCKYQVENDVTKITNLIKEPNNINISNIISITPTTTVFSLIKKKLYIKQIDFI